MEKQANKISIVVPILNEEKNILPLYSKITEVFKTIPYEIIFVDDGSIDGTFDILKGIYSKDKCVNVIRLAANFGKSSAYTAGFAAARGNVVATMDGDMQDDPKDILLLLDKMRQGFDVVVGWKVKGKSSQGKLIMSKFSNFIIKLATGIKINDMNCPLRVLKINVAHRLNLYGDMYRFIPLLANGMGFKMAQVKVSNAPRLHGHTNYSYRKYLNGFFDLISAYFSSKYYVRPLHFFGRIGLLSLSIGFLLDFWLTGMFVLGIERIDENLPTLILGVLLIILGSLFFAVGLLGDMQIRNMSMINPRMHFRIEDGLFHDKGTAADV